MKYQKIGVLLLIAGFLFVLPANAQEAEALDLGQDGALAEVDEPSSETGGLDLPLQNGTLGPEDHKSLEGEYEQLTEDVEQTAGTDEFDDGLLSGGETDMVVGDDGFGTSEEAAQDEFVTNEDLGVAEGSRVGLFDKVGRFFKKAVTFDDVKDSELDLQFMREDLVELQHRWGEGIDDQKGVEKIIKEIDNVNRRIEKIVKRVDDLHKGQEEGDVRVDGFLDDVLDTQIKQQKIFSKIGEEALDYEPEIAQRLFEKADMARQKSARAVGDVFSKVGEDGEHLTERIDRVLKKQRGSEFKNFRNLEVLQQIGERVPEQAREAILRAQDNALNRFNKEFERIPEEDRARHAEKFESYVRDVGGDETIHMEIFDRIRQLEDVPEELRQKIEVAKDIAARRIQNNVERFEGDNFEQEFRDRMREREFARFKENEPDVAKMRVMEEIRQRVNFEDEDLQKEMEQRHTEGLNRFREAFSGDTGAQDVADRFEKLSKQMADNPDPTAFRLIEELEKELTPEQREFMDKMEREVKTKFIERARSEGEKFFQQIESNNPEDIETLQRLKEEFAQNPEMFFAPPPPPFGDEEGFAPPGVGPDGFGPPPFVGGGRFFDQAIQHQSGFITDYVEHIDNPEALLQFKQKFVGADEDVFEKLNQNGIDFRGRRDNKQDMIRGQELRDEERKAHDKIQEENRNIERIFQEKYGSAKGEEELKQVREEERRARQAVMDKEFELRKQTFKKDLSFDPFCDDECRREEEQLFNQTMDGGLEKRRQEMDEMYQYENIKQEVYVFEDQKRLTEEDGRRKEEERRWEEERRIQDGGQMEPLDPSLPHPPPSEFRPEERRLEIKPEGPLPVGEIHDNRYEMPQKDEEVRFDKPDNYIRPEPRDFDRGDMVREEFHNDQMPPNVLPAPLTPKEDIQLPPPLPSVDSSANQPPQPQPMPQPQPEPV